MSGLEEGTTVAPDLSNDPHIRALREALVAEHEATIADAQRHADEAGARRRPQSKLANQLAGGSRGRGDAHRVEIGVAQDSGQRG